MYKRLDYVSINAAAIDAMVKAKHQMKSIDIKLRAIVETRISQINGCSYCVDLHLREARKAGESQQRLDCLAVWRECGFFTPAECAALEWAEAITHIAASGVPEEMFKCLKDHFTDEQIVDLTIIASQMNAWNRLAVSMGHTPQNRG